MTSRMADRAWSVPARGDGEQSASGRLHPGAQRGLARMHLETERPATRAPFNIGEDGRARALGTPMDVARMADPAAVHGSGVCAVLQRDGAGGAWPEPAALQGAALAGAGRTLTGRPAVRGNPRTAVRRGHTCKPHCGPVASMLNRMRRGARGAHRALPCGALVRRPVLPVVAMLNT